MKFNIMIGIIEIAIYLVCLAYAITTAVKRYKKKQIVIKQGKVVQRKSGLLTFFLFLFYIASFTLLVLVFAINEFRSKEIGFHTLISFLLFIYLFFFLSYMQIWRRLYVYFDNEGVKFLNDDNRLIPYQEIDEALYYLGYNNTLILRVNGKIIRIFNIAEEDFDLKIAPHIKNHSKKYRHKKRKNSN